MTPIGVDTSLSAVMKTLITFVDIFKEKNKEIVSGVGIGAHGHLPQSSDENIFF